MIFRTLLEGELDLWVRHCISVFRGPTDTYEYFCRHFTNDPDADINGIFVAEDDGKIAATVRVFVREVYIGGVRVKMGGIGEVSTKEEYRGQGLSGRLLQMAVAYMEREDMPVSMLFTGIHQHYARYGWFTVCSRCISAVPAGELPPGAVLRPLTDADMPAARGLYALSAGRFDGAVVRAHPDYWQNWVRAEWKNPMLLELDGRALCYADIGEDENALHINDYGTVADKDYLLPMLAAYRPGKRAVLPEVFLTDQNGPFVEDRGLMLRLNKPFYTGGERIDTAAKLSKCMASPAFFGIDGF